MKHSDYKSPCEMVVTRLGDIYRLEYPQENYELVGSLDEVLEEIKEHLGLMRKNNG